MVTELNYLNSRSWEVFHENIGLITSQWPCLAPWNIPVEIRLRPVKLLIFWQSGDLDNMIQYASA